MEDRANDGCAVHVRVTGRVQGVSFRAACAQEARRLGVTGWVANEPDGTVSGHFEGTAAEVEALVRWCRTGPPHARVADVAVTGAPVEGHPGFEDR